MHKAGKRKREQKEDDKLSEDVYNDKPEDIPFVEEQIFYGSKKNEDTRQDLDLIEEIQAVPKTLEERKAWQRVIVILDKASLQLTKTKRGTIELMN